METQVDTAGNTVEIFRSETLIKGQPTAIDCLRIDGQTFSVNRNPFSLVSLADEWYEDVRTPYALIEALKKHSGATPDIFTFWQRLPDLDPKYPFYCEWESIAVLPVISFDHWWTEQISSRTRNLIRKAKKDGLEVRQTTYDDNFVRGMTDIFNETPVRQGRRFWHYGKNFETVKRQFSRFISREEMIGAYHKGEMVGFMMVGDAGRFALTGQILSKLKHRDKATNNALIAKAVELCENKSWPYLVYLYWSDTSLSEFKRRCGFRETKVPRYFVPLTPKGELALRLGLHRGWKAAIPNRVWDSLRKMRAHWYSLIG
jgi:hypothetical protein